MLILAWMHRRSDSDRNSSHETLDPFADIRPTVDVKKFGSESTSTYLFRNRGGTDRERWIGRGEAGPREQMAKTKFHCRGLFVFTPSPSVRHHVCICGNKESTRRRGVYVRRERGGPIWEKMDETQP